MFDSIREKATRYDEIEKLIQDPSVAADHPRYAALMKERGRLSKTVLPYKELEDVQRQKKEAQELASFSTAHPYLPAAQVPVNRKSAGTY